MEVALALLADYANVTADGKLNILGVFDTIFADRFPAVHPQMQLVLRLEAHPAEAGSQKKFEIRLMTDEGRHVFSIAAEMAVQAKDPSKLVGVACHNGPARFAANWICPACDRFD